MANGLDGVIDRRDVLRRGRAAAAGLAAVALMPACVTVPIGPQVADVAPTDHPQPNPARPEPRDRTLTLVHRPTQETLTAMYRRDGDYDRDALRSIDYFLRDRRVDMMVEMDPRLLDLMQDIQMGFGGRPIDVLSAYRTPETNRMLRRRGRGAARNSLHMRGMAIDVRMKGVQTRHLRTTAVQLAAGGVGYYPRRGFIHMDTGAVRTW